MKGWCTTVEKGGRLASRSWKGGVRPSRDDATPFLLKRKKRVDHPLRPLEQPGLPCLSPGEQTLFAPGGKGRRALDPAYANGEGGKGGVCLTT